MILKAFFLIIVLAISSLTVYAQQQGTVNPDHLLHVSIKGTENVAVENTWVTMNRENYIFQVDRFAEEFDKSICENKYYYEIKTPKGAVYWNHFCPRGRLIWDGALTIEEDIEHKQDMTTLVLPFFEEAYSIDVLDKDGTNVLSIPLTGYKKIRTEIAEEKIPIIEKPSKNITGYNETIKASKQQIPETEKQELNTYALIQISGGLLVLVILIAIFIVRIKSTK